MCSSGSPAAASTSSAIRCIVFEQITSSPAPPAFSRRAAPTISRVAPAQSPAAWSASTSAKSNDHIRISAECSPPSRSRASSLSWR
jgi:hypothetical protein